LGTLLLIFASSGLETKFKLAPRQLVRVCLLAGAAWLLAILALGETRFGEISQKFASISPRPKERWHVTKVTDWVRHHVSPTDRLVVDSFNDEESSLQYHVRLPPEQVRIYWNPNQSIEDMLTPQPRFLIYAKAGALAKGLGLDWDAVQQTKRGLDFIRCYTNEVYAVFEVRPGSS
jgi:hypothetical protein